MRTIPLLLFILLALIADASPVAAQTIDELWIGNCAQCHGDRAQGGGAGTRSLLTEAKRARDLDRPFFDAIKHGLPDQGMEAFGQTLSDATIWALVVHLRELQARDHRQRTGTPAPDRGVFKTQHHHYTVEPLITKGLDTPWAVAFLSDGAMLITERPGTLRTFKDARLSPPIDGIPPVRDRGQGGLMDVAVHPGHADNGWIYLAFSDRIRDTRDKGMTRIVRGKLIDTRWSDQQTIFVARPEHYLPTDIHFGCHIVFDGDGHLFFGIGERGRADHAQDLTRPNGKVHRLHDDGAVPADNPFIDTPDAYPSIWSFGHRNPQGLTFDLAGHLWETEHGPRGGDELNIILKGRNYGWPLVSFGINYNGSPFRTPWPSDALADKNIVLPVDRWLPSIGACGLDVARGPAFEHWQGDLLAGGLSGANVDRIRLRPGGGSDAQTPWQVVEREEILYGLGRVRDVVSGPDGLIYIVLNDPDQIIRLLPAGPLAPPALPTPPAGSPPRQ